MCDNTCSALSGRTIPFGLVCVPAVLSFAVALGPAAFSRDVNRACSVLHVVSSFRMRSRSLYLGAAFLTHFLLQGCARISHVNDVIVLRDCVHLLRCAEYTSLCI